MDINSINSYELIVEWKMTPMYSPFVENPNIILHDPFQNMFMIGVFCEVGSQL